MSIDEEIPPHHIAVYSPDDLPIEISRLTLDGKTNSRIFLDLLICTGDGYQIIFESGGALYQKEYKIKNYSEVTEDVRKSYGSRFSGTETELLFRCDVPPEKANIYPARFNASEIVALYLEGVSPEYAEKYQDRLAIINMLRFSKKIEEPMLDQLLERLDPCHIDYFPSVGQDLNDVAKKASAYHERFKPDDVYALMKYHVSPEEAARFDARYDSYNILQLNELRCPPETANSYDKRLQGDAVCALVALGVAPGIDFPEGSAIHESLKNIVRFMNMKRKYDDNHNPWDITDEMIGKKEIIAMGSQGIIILDKKYTLTGAALVDHEEKIVYVRNGKKQGKLSRLLSRIKSHLSPKSEAHYELPVDGGSYIDMIRKFSENPEKEFRFLEKLAGAKHIVRAKGYDMKKNILLEFIPGNTLEHLISKYGPLPEEKVRLYGWDILCGIEEMRMKGIYHRDIHDRNIMIDSKVDRAVIIDLGVATEDPSEIHPKNRSYGGNNDLVSLGQLMYKMATGHNLFNEGPGFSCYSFVKDGIKTEREKAYDDPELKSSYLSKVGQDIKDKALAEIIMKLLDDDLWKQPSLENVQEAKKRFKKHQKNSRIKFR